MWSEGGGHEIPNWTIKTANAICGQRVSRQKPLPAALGHHFIGAKAHDLHCHMSWATLTVLRSYFRCSLHLHTAAAPMGHLPSPHSSSDGPHSSPVAYSWAKRRPGNLCCCQCGRADFMWLDHVSSARLASCSVWFLWLLLWPKNKTTKRRQATAW